MYKGEFRREDASLWISVNHGAKGFANEIWKLNYSLLFIYWEWSVTNEGENMHLQTV